MYLALKCVYIHWRRCLQRAACNILILQAKSVQVQNLPGSLGTPLGAINWSEKDLVTKSVNVVITTIPTHMQHVWSINPIACFTWFVGKLFKLLLMKSTSVNEPAYKTHVIGIQLLQKNVEFPSQQCASSCHSNNMYQLSIHVTRARVFCTFKI